MANNIKINNPVGSQPQQKKGSGFVNLNKILQANVGNRLGQTVAGGLGQGAKQVQQGLGDVKNQFIQESDKQNLASDTNRNAVSTALNNIATGNTNVSDDQAQQFGTFLSGQYTGPTELDSSKINQIGSKAQEIQGMGQSLAGGGDTTRLLQAFAGKGPYTAGQTRLDSLLLGQGPQAKQQLAEARQNTRGLTQQVGKEQEIAQQVGQLRGSQAQEFGQSTLKGLTDAETSVQTAANAQKDPLIQGQKNLLTQLYNAGADLTPEQLAFIGIEGETRYVGPGAQHSSLGINSQIPLGEPGAGVYTSPEQRAALAALAKLKGRTYETPQEQYYSTPEQTLSSQVYKEDGGQMSIPEYIDYIKKIRAEEAGNQTAPITPPGGDRNRKRF